MQRPSGGSICDRETKEHKAPRSATAPFGSPNPSFSPSLTKPGIWQESKKAAASFNSCFWSRTSSWQDSGNRTPGKVEQEGLSQADDIRGAAFCC